MNAIAKLPPLNALRAFEAAQRHMSFQRAAEELHVTPAALSYQIRQLEEFLQTKLFNRLNRAVELTKQGRQLATGTQEGFSILRQTMTQFSRLKKNNVLIVSAGPAFSTKWLVPRLYRFMARHPEIEIRLSSSLEVVDLTIGDVDIGLRFGKGAYPGCISTKLADDCLTPMYSPHLLGSGQAIEKPADLIDLPLIHDHTHVGEFRLPDWQDWFKFAGITDAVDTSSGPVFDIANNALDAAIAGVGVVLGRTVLASGDLETGKLITPFDLRIKSNLAFFAAYDQRRGNEKNIQLFVQWVKDEVDGVIDTQISVPLA